VAATGHFTDALGGRNVTEVTARIPMDRQWASRQIAKQSWLDGPLMPHSTKFGTCCS
jgi:hypothetical protein